MKRNAIVPYFLIMLFGIGLIFALSIIGSNEQAGGGGGGDVRAPEDIYATNCASCHGGNYEGASGPSLLGVGQELSTEEITDVLINGRPGTAMPGGLVPNREELEGLIEWLSTLGEEE